jgi:hypothetical protein
MSEDNLHSGPTFRTVSQIIELLEPLDSASREHVLRTVITWLKVPISNSTLTKQAPLAEPEGEGVPADNDKFSNRPELSVKDFIFEKDPVTEPERLACLAYYLTHYLDTPHFKTIDLSRLNTEAAQRKLSNPTVAANNATRDGYFVSAPRAGYKQLSAMGERFVHALPNRESAKQIKQRMSSRRRRATGGNSEESGSNNIENGNIEDAR